MISRKTLKTCLQSSLMGASFFVLAACQPTAEVFVENDIPHAQLGENVTPSAYRIDMRINPDEVGYSGVVEIDVRVDKPTTQIWLHGKEMTVPTASFTPSGGEPIALTFTEIAAADAPSGVSRLNSETVIPSGKGVLTMHYETPFNLALNSAYKVTRGEDNYLVTQMEPIGAREAFPGFDEPRFKVPFTVSITSPADDVVYFNTPKTNTTPMDDGWVKHEFETTRPLPTYLIAYGVGPYDINDFGDIPANNIRSRGLALRGLTTKGDANKIEYGLENTEVILTALENYFGSEYPYEKLDLIAAPEYAFGAMENPGAIVYRESLMLLNEDSALSQKRGYARVHSHELAHQWFGNLVTPFWWEDIWLNEAFATWSGNKGTHLAFPDGNYDRLTLNAALGAMNIDSLSTTRKVREPLLRSENVIDQFDGITYRKGGGVLSMFESFVGEEAFRDGVHLHMKRYADDVATADDFFQSIAEGSKNPDVVDAMKSFVDQKGVPLVRAELTCSNNQTEINLTQSRYAPLGSSIKQGPKWDIPVCVAYGIDGTRGKSCTLMKEQTTTLKPETKGCADWATLNADGAGYYRFSMDGAAWDNLLDNIDQLNTREVLTVSDSLSASFSAGAVSADNFLKGMEGLAAHPEYDVASTAGQRLGFMYNELPESSRDDLARYTQDLFKARYEKIVGTSTIEGRLLAPTLAGRLIFFGQDQDLRREFAANGIAYLDGDKNAIAPNLLGQALGQAMRVGNNATADQLLELVKNGSAFEKGAALGALSATQDERVYARLMDMALNDEEFITGRQANGLVGGFLGSDKFGDQTWEWFKANFAPFVNKRVPDVRKGSMPGFARGFCSAERGVEVKDFFEANAEVIPGYQRSLKQTLESIELCAAFKDKMAEPLQVALAER
ncbi:MAG: M1 family aminopeptidase [Maricaulaceae bacterium]